MTRASAVALIGVALSCSLAAAADDKTAPPPPAARMSAPASPQAPVGSPAQPPKSDQERIAALEQQLSAAAEAYNRLQGDVQTLKREMTAEEQFTFPVVKGLFIPSGNLPDAAKLPAMLPRLTPLAVFAASPQQLGQGAARGAAVAHFCTSRYFAQSLILPVGPQTKSILFVCFTAVSIGNAPVDLGPAATPPAANRPRAAVRRPAAPRPARPQMP